MRRLMLVATLGLVMALAVPAGQAAEHLVTERATGTDRIDTAVALSAGTFAAGSVDTAVVAWSRGFADALAATPLAGAIGGPVLLNPRDGLDDRVAAELDRLGASEVLLMGGEAVQSAGVRQQLENAGYEVTRISGPNRFGTAAAAARAVIDRWEAAGASGVGERAIVALGAHPVDASRAWPDALVAGVLGGYTEQPILLVEPGGVPDATEQLLDELGTTQVTLIGGPGAVPETVADQLRDLGIDVTRIGGANRYDTAALLMDRILDSDVEPDTVVVATGTNFPDALGAGPVALARGGVLLLVPPGDLDAVPAAADALRSLRDRIATLVVAGGAAVVPDSLVGQVEWALDGLGDLGLGLEVVADGLATPLVVTAPPGDDRLFVAERGGTIRVVRDGQLASEPFVDISDQVSTGGERGLLGLAFHPQYASNGRFFLHYSDNAGDTVVSEMSADPASDRARPGEAVLLTVDQPASNHNGGGLVVGPDGMLYLGLGDGGGANDQYGNGQNTDTVLGTIVRLDVSQVGRAVAASDNPFVGRPGDERIWQYGLRNPYRFSFDPVTGLQYIGDVGQGTWEEVDVVAGGAQNFGWSVLEGNECFQSSNCDRSGLTPPVEVYGHDGGNCSITGGVVHRGEIGRFRGHYLYGDFCSGRIFSLRYENGAATEQREWTDTIGFSGPLYSIGQGPDGATYLMNSSTVFRLVEQ